MPEFIRIYSQSLKQQKSIFTDVVIATSSLDQYIESNQVPMLNHSWQVVTVRAPKRLDVLTLPHLARDLNAKIQPGKMIVLDLSGTQFLAPESADVILHGLVLARQCDARFSLRGVNEAVRYTLDTTGVLQYFRKSAT